MESVVATKLRGPLKREISVDGKAFVVTLAPDVMRLVGKGRRKGLDLAWKDLISGDAALATALNASLNQKLHLEPGGPMGKKSRSKRKKARKHLRVVRG
jgi:hypothetical protein